MNIFVLAPFTWDFDYIFERHIRVPLEAKGHSVQRSLESDHQNGVRAIIQGIIEADLIIADLTRQNSNVTYELGIAHTFKRPTLQIAQSLQDIRYDLRSYNAIIYSINLDGSSDLSKQLIDKIQPENGRTYIFSNPVSDFETLDLGQVITIADPNEELRRENIGSENGDYALLDARVDSQNAIESISQFYVEMTVNTSNLDPAIQELNEKLQELSVNRDHPSPDREALKLFGEFAGKIRKYSSKIDSRIPSFREAWNKLDLALGQSIMLSTISGDEDILAVGKIISEMREFQDSGRSLIGSISEFSDSLRQLLGLSNATNQALNGAMQSHERLLDEITLGDAVLTRMVALAYGKLDRYENSS